MSRGLKIVLAALLMLLLLGASLVFVTLRTETGASWVIRAVSDQAPGLEFAAYEGDLSGGVTLIEPRFEGEGISLKADRLALALSPRLGPLRLHVRFVEADGLLVTVLDMNPGDKAGEWPESLGLPFPVELERLDVAGLTVSDAAGKTHFHAKSVTASAAAHEKLSLRQVGLVLPDGRLDLGGQVALSRPFRVELDADGEYGLALEDVSEPLRIEASAKLRGTLGAYRLGIDGSAVLDRFELTAVGEMDLENTRFEGRLEWRDFTWPLDREAVQVESSTGQLQLTGWIDDWGMDGSAELAAPGIAAGELSFLAEGDRKGARVVVPEAWVLGGQIAGEGRYDWSEPSALEARVEMDRVATGPLFPEWGAVLSGGLTLAGGLDPAEFLLVAQDLRADVDTRTVTANGRMRYRRDELTFEEFILQSSGSSVRLNGSLDRNEGILFEADVPALQDFLPEAAGRLQGTGRLVAGEGFPQLELDLEGSGLAWGDYRADGVHVAGEPGKGPEQLGVLRVQFTGAGIGEFHLDAAVVTADIGRERQDFELQARGSGYRLSARLPGAVQNTSDAWPAWRWLGRLDSLLLESGPDEMLLLEQGAPLEASLERLALGTACLKVAGRARACLDGEWSKDSGLLAGAALDRIPLNLVSSFGGDFEFTQSLAGNATLRKSPATGLEADARLTLSPGAVRFQMQKEAIFTTGEGTIGLRMEDGAITAGTFDLPIVDQGRIGLDFRSGRLDDGLDAPVSGRLVADLDDLDALAMFLPLADEIRGELDIDMSVLGTLGHPWLEGRVALTDGYVRHAASGLVLSDVQLSGQADGGGRTSLAGEFKTQKGEGHLEGLIDLSKPYAPSVQLDVTGEDLVLFDSSDLRLVTHPDFRLSWHGAALHIDGQVVIPSARLAPSVLPAPRVVESPDVVIVAGAPPQSQLANGKPRRIDVFGQLDVVVGNDVEVDLSVAEADVSGQARFEWNGPAIPVANGGFNLSGLVLAFGQRLEITEGRIGFPGVPADNPHLNIRAEREIYGNSEVRRAGLWVTGTLRRPQLEPYTTPMTTRERAQTLLVTGSDFNMERGSGAVSVGTYIAPRVFVSYGIGVFDESSVISVRYDLGRGWGIMGTSGERQTGVDVSYTIER